MEDKNKDKKADISKKNVVEGGSRIEAENVNIGDQVTNNYYGVNENRSAEAGSLEEIRRLISRGRVDKAIDKLLARANQEDEGLADEIHLLSQNWQKLKKKERMGLISNSEATVEGNKITHGLLQFLRQLEND